MLRSFLFVLFLSVPAFAQIYTCTLTEKVAREDALNCEQFCIIEADKALISESAEVLNDTAVVYGQKLPYEFIVMKNGEKAAAHIIHGEKLYSRELEVSQFEFNIRFDTAPFVKGQIVGAVLRCGISGKR